MKSIRNNRIIVSLDKVQYAHFYYRNQYGVRWEYKPDYHTVRGEKVPTALALFHPDFPKESCFDRVKRLGILDVWHPELLLKLQANACLIYTGDKALSLWEAWKAKQFGSKKK